MIIVKKLLLPCYTIFEKPLADFERSIIWDRLDNLLIASTDADVYLNNAQMTPMNTSTRHNTINAIASILYLERTHTLCYNFAVLKWQCY